MKKLIKESILNNLYFIAPAILWFILGGILLFIKTKDELFFPINHTHTPSLNILNDVFSAYGRGDVIALLLVWLLIIPIYRNRQYIITSLVFGILIPTIIYYTKYFFNRPRPISYYGLSKVQTVSWLDNYLNNSFPSGHTLGAFGFFMLLSLFLPKQYKPWSLLFFVLALCVGFSRIYLGQHFFEDIYAGSIAGTLITLLIFVTIEYISNRRKKENQMKKIVALIPARLNASRFPQKLMKELDGKTIILRTYEAIKEMNLFDDVLVVCDEETIFNEIQKNGGRAVLSTKEYESGTDRIAEVAATIEANIIVNVQGDEPFISKDALQKVIALFNNPLVDVGSLILPITNKASIENPNCVKVVVDKNFKAMYFSRSPIPFVRDENSNQQFYKHIGVYAFKKESLLAFTQLPISQLERTEKLENLRMLENGMNVYMAVVNEVGISIDTPEDFELAKKYLTQSNA